MEDNQFPINGEHQTDDPQSTFAADMVQDLIGDTEMDSSTTPDLKDFNILGLLKVIEDAINAECYDIEILLGKIYFYCKGTKAEPFLVKLKEYFEQKYNPAQNISKLIKKFGSIFTSKEGEVKKPTTKLETVAVETPIIQPPEEIPMFQHAPPPILQHSYQDMEHVDIDASQSFHEFIDHLQNQNFPDFPRGGRGGHHRGHRGFFRGLGRGFHHGRGRGGFFPQFAEPHGYFPDQMNEVNSNSSESSHRASGRKKSKDRKSDREDYKEEQRKKIVVVSDHRGFIPGKPGSYVPVDITLENQSQKGVPKNTYICQVNKKNEVELEPLNLVDKIRSGHNKAVTLMVKLPTKPGEYRCSFKFCIKQNKEIGTRFDLCFLAHEGDE
ncbi:unnamed protein product [Moneuplotes crassus]|uniref:Uncharacterized protein n=1 Tax=Euplotes crassus TaxID=5936 RepID=A0AAD1UPE5_EUPCR|nr:unnamed protein product [Moneuplotes crassus]